MMVTFVSQCEKKALLKTRRVLDAFANRIGDNTWQTVITNEGLIAVKSLLKKSATKNTAVACHWLRSRSRSELVWVVGNRQKFNDQGIVPVNTTMQEVEQYRDVNAFKILPVMEYATTIAALFHDFGKATKLFQKKINPQEKTEKFEPYRHEWVSYRLFQGFVGNKTDDQWLGVLSDINEEAFSKYFRDGLDSSTSPSLSDLPPFAQLVAWLILTHHKLPIYPGWRKEATSPPDLKHIDNWLARNFEPLWNSHNCWDEDQKGRVEENWTLCDLPIKSIQWRCSANILASEARVKMRAFLNNETDWLHGQLFTAHLSRLSLTLADHYYSSLAIEDGSEEWRNENYTVYANTENGQYKQQLDEHLIGVAHHSRKIIKALAGLSRSLGSLEPSESLLGNVSKELKLKFGWQDKARRQVENIGKTTIEKGFFGINLASTGKGKTRANAKIMSALGLETERVRFSVALGLRVLTLQTGKEFQEELKIPDADLVVAVGGIAVKQLFENVQSQEDAVEKDPSERIGSESQEELLDASLYVHYKGASNEHSLSQWTQKEKGLDALLTAPVLVSTIDHLMPATEGTKGGKQIAGMLRLLTSDLVLDEPDDFGLDDLPALTRLVHWAGMLGSRVLLSTATIPPALANALFRAYKSGWHQYAKANLDSWSGEIVCSWFDEWGCDHGQYKDDPDFKKAHEKFVGKRVKNLKLDVVKRRAKIIKVGREEGKTIAESMALVMQKELLGLHEHHHLKSENKTLSIGLMRMANINPLVAVAKALIKKPVPREDTCIHYCIYHSRYPLAIRSAIESKLDRLLCRKDPAAIWQAIEIRDALKKHPEVKNHIFAVLASPVAEVGRDHDYDWAIVEPSSMRSVIQLAGRVLRHRDVIPKEENIILLNQNYKSLSKKNICFCLPGFETKHIQLKDHDLFSVLEKSQYEQVSAVERIRLPDKKIDYEYQNLIGLEHKALAKCLFDKEFGANLWWDHKAIWCGELQRQQRFRRSQKDNSYYLWLVNENDYLEWKWKNEAVSPVEFGLPTIEINKVELEPLGLGNDFWFKQDALAVYQELAIRFDVELEEVSRRFGEVRLTEYETGGSSVYEYHPNLGIYQNRSEI